MKSYKKGSISTSKFSKSFILTCRKFGSDYDNCDDYKVRLHSKEEIEVKTRKLVCTRFTESFYYNKYRPIKQSQEYIVQISGKIAKWVKRVDVEMRLPVFRPSDPTSFLFFLLNFKKACDSDRMHERGAM